MNQRHALLSLSLLPLLLAGCISTGPGAGNGRGEPATTGSLQLSGPTFGEVTLAPSGCRSGEHEVFLGADFSSPDSDLVVRLVVDPLEAPGVRIFDRNNRSGKTLVLRKADCAGFEAYLGRKGWQLNDVYVLEAHIQLDCTLPGGDRITGRVATESCW